MSYYTISTIEKNRIDIIRSLNLHYETLTKGIFINFYF